MKRGLGVIYLHVKKMISQTQSCGDKYYKTSLQLIQQHSHNHTSYNSTPQPHHATSVPLYNTLQHSTTSSYLHYITSSALIRPHY
ncbi:hypothetical protein E2C01_045972 [Portunus trituberculatus]|uniref:Uncharacterized protein n=1 Tax=Portunus trituberculatus TaxID=210409 RepID=A0A5B7FX69_PORTR|nr:hypothetical protein [Portunus trituberculatus]